MFDMQALARMTLMLTPGQTIKGMKWPLTTTQASQVTLLLHLTLHIQQSCSSDNTGISNAAMGCFILHLLSLRGMDDRAQCAQCRIAVNRRPGMPASPSKCMVFEWLCRGAGVSGRVTGLLEPVCPARRCHPHADSCQQQRLLIWQHRQQPPDASWLLL